MLFFLEPCFPLDLFPLLVPLSHQLLASSSFSPQVNPYLPPFPSLPFSFCIHSFVHFSALDILLFYFPNTCPSSPSSPFSAANHHLSSTLASFLCSSLILVISNSCRQTKRMGKEKKDDGTPDRGNKSCVLYSIV